MAGKRIVGRNRFVLYKKMWDGYRLYNISIKTIGYVRKSELDNIKTIQKDKKLFKHYDSQTTASVEKEIVNFQHLEMKARTVQDIVSSK